MGLTGKQWLQVANAIIGSLITSAALFTTLFGQDLATKIIAILGIVNTIISSIGAAVSGQASLVRDVAAMPGVEKITVNEKANQTLATVAVDENVAKVEATPKAEKAVAATAKGDGI